MNLIAILKIRTALRRCFYGACCFVIVLLGCGKKDESSKGLDFWISPSVSFILPGRVSGDSTLCYSSDVIGPRIHFQRATTIWEGEGDFYPVVLKIEFKASGVLNSNYKCEISGGEGTYSSLSAFLGAGTDTDFFSTAASTQKNSDCPIDCGNFPVSDEDLESAFKLVGEAKLSGYSIKQEEDGTLTQIPIRKTSKITVENIP